MSAPAAPARLSDNALAERAIALSLSCENAGELCRKLIAEGASDEEAVQAARHYDPQRAEVESAPVMLATIPTRAEAILGCAPSEVRELHAEIVCGVVDFLSSRNLQFDALGALRRNGVLAAESIVSIADCVAFELRKSRRVDRGIVIETAEHIQRIDAAAAAKVIHDGLLELPWSERGQAEARRWLAALTGDVCAADMQALLHWLWSAKRKQSDRKCERHLMLVLTGQQGSGKSRAVASLALPWCEMVKPDMRAADLTDDRKRPLLAKYAIGIFDELSGLGRADCDEIKQIITADAVTYRPMRTNSDAQLPVRMSFIGTSNHSVSQVFRDPTGNRRFYEIQCREKIDWAEINAINYSLLWASVDERQPSPADFALVSARQLGQRYRDPVERWVDECGPREPIPCADAWQSFRCWSESNGEKPGTSEALGRRLAALGWEKSRPRMAGSRTWAYVPPARKEAGHLDHLDHADQSAPSGPGGPGGPSEIFYPSGFEGAP